MSEMPVVSSGSEEKLEDSIALCLSGGGYRAMLFHLGVLWYLNDAGLLSKIARFSSVSGGSVTAATLALHWNELTRDTRGVATNFTDVVVKAIRKMASTTIDTPAVLKGVFGPGKPSDRVMKSYDDVLFFKKTLQDLPDSPRFVINATNVQTGSLMRFSKPYIADYQVGQILKPKRPIAEAVAASAAFAPFFSPLRVDFNDAEWTNRGPLGRPPFTTHVFLTDGGVYDNLGLETAWKRCKTVFVSDGGAKMQPEEEPSAAVVGHLRKIESLTDNQVRSLRKRQVVSSYLAGIRKGTYWGMWTDPAEYPATSKLSLPSDRARELATTPTRLSKMKDDLQERLINFGYGMCERAIRSYYDPAALAAAGFPYARGI
ncbi:MAG TPA: patatin-like phospholipase family protein [Thermoanaerobaculia bacterium]|nr:patatin-like phospholipase family protein [Thermoanaerobaculia bacterium]